jgi:hypothetical protein
MVTDRGDHFKEGRLHLLHQRAAAGDSKAAFDLAEQLAEANCDADSLESLNGAAGLGLAGAAARQTGDAIAEFGGGRGVPSVARPKVFVMGKDVFSNALILLPALDARRDVAFNKAMQGHLSMGQIRAIPGLVEQIDRWLVKNSDGGDPWDELLGVSRDAAPDDACPSLDESSWMWLEASYLIVAAPRCEELAPPEIMAEFGRDDGFTTGLSDDHSWAEFWLDPVDAERIRTRMHQLGYLVFDNQELINGYS